MSRNKSGDPYIVRCFNKRGDRVAEFFHTRIEDAVLRRETWIAASGIIDPAKYPTIWQWDDSKHSFMRITEY